MYESRLCFLFTIFVACLQQYCLCLPQSYNPTDFYSSHPYYSYSHLHAGVYNSVPALTNATLDNNQTSANVNAHVSAVPSNYFAPQAPLPLQQNPYAPPAAYQPPVPTYAPPSAMFHSSPQTTFYSPPFHGSAPPNPTYHPYSGSYAIDAQSQQASQAQNHVMHPAQPAFHHSFHQQSPYSHPGAPDPLHLSHPPPSNSFAPYSGYQSQPVSSYPAPNDGYAYNLPHAVMPFNTPAASHYAAMNHVGYDSASKTTKKVTPTTPRPKTTTATPKPLEFELSIEDFFYLSQLHQMFNKSLDKQGIDISSLTKSMKMPGDDKDESPVFYGGVLDLEELSKIDNMKDLMEAFKKVEPKTQVSRKGAESGASDNPDDGEDEEREPHQETGGRRRKGSHDATRSRTPARNKQRNKKKRRKESDRSDHGNEDEEQEEAGDNDESEGESEETDEKIGIGSTPSTSQLDTRHKKQRGKTAVSSSTTVAPVAIYPNPYLYSMPYNYPQMQQQYMQQLQAMSGHLQSLSQPAEKEVTKFPDEEPLTSPNENRNVINVNIADPRKVGDSLKNDVNQDTGSGTSGIRFPLRRGSFNSMANGLAKKALTSILYRIFPTMKHLNVKGVAARGCRDVQSIGSLDSIIMPLGLAVTLHPLLLPLVPFLLLALGSIKAIESATCFVSEYFT